MDQDGKILKIALDKITAEFQQFIESCLDENLNPKTPTTKDLIKARACLPNKYSLSLKKK